MADELFTIGILSYNQWEYIFSCVDSVLCQDYPAIELIISDDCSSDFDSDALRMYIEKRGGGTLKRFMINQMPQNAGTVKNNNYVLSMASGRFLKIIAADDRFASGQALSIAASALTYNGVICARASVCTRDGSPVLDAVYPGETDFRLLKEAPSERMYSVLSERPWSVVFAPAMFWECAYLRKLGGFDESYKYTEDWPLFLKLYSLGENIRVVDKQLVLYRLGGISNPEKRQSHVNSKLRMIHYKECIRLLKRTAFPRLVKRKHFIAAFRCLLSAWYIRYRLVRECAWDELNSIKKFVTRLVYLPSILYVRMMKSPGLLR